uniref:ribosomal protein L32 n=1 Tax=Palisada intermedia TaxID=397057 RepID=UPI00286C0CD7|nr:ribosomal protein L32 [Palisada intermedia]WKW95779.1 ribosomal protein L32 [Palisada intermedia]
MAVPKKKTSKSKSRKSHWHRKAESVSRKSFSFAMSLLSRNSVSFVYNKSVDSFDN